MTSRNTGRGKTAQSLQPSGIGDGNSVTKRSREDLDQVGEQDQALTLDNIMNRMQMLFEETNRKIDRYQGELRKDIDTLRCEVQQFKNDCRDEVNKLAASVSTVRTDVCLNKERMAVNEKATDLLLSGVPYNPTENLDSFIMAVSNALGYTEQEIPLIYAKRLARLPKQVGSTPPIIMQFAFKIAREDFYRRYLSSRNLSLLHLGFSVNQRIYINESLTELGRKIKAEALKLKRDGKLHAVFTRGGSVYVKTAMDAEAVPAHRLDLLPK
ncbi:uncharacterized protein LOC129719262 [Wyeomyia smithii]|uniref:uncharacterized protein LOC129719262 n=1 Tax=Wyeomyia smithii TaxID=174621 RepID=UPI002467BE97|nr:uncharacterized protein LOC129719262 [Wyeomyia smithii]